MKNENQIDEQKRGGHEEQGKMDQPAETTTTTGLDAAKAMPPTKTAFKEDRRTLHHMYSTASKHGN